MIDNSQALDFSRSIVQFYDPYARLSLRVEVDDAIGSFSELRSELNEVDVTAVLDAVYKRSGLQTIEMRMEQIYLSLPYYSKATLDYWVSIIKKLPQQLLEYVQQNSKISGQPFIQVHLLPLYDSNGLINQKREVSNHLNYMRQEIDSKQLYFLRKADKDQYLKFDQYYCLKTLAYFGADLSRVDKRFHKKYQILRQLMFINDSICGELQFTQANSSSFHKSKICVVGLNITSILLAAKLLTLGFEVSLVQRNPEIINSWKRGHIPDLLKQGLYLTNQVENKKLQNLIKKHMNIAIEVQSCKNEITKCLEAYSWKQPVQSCESSLMNDKDENQEYQKQQTEAINIQQTYITLLDQIIQEFPMNRDKIFWMQIQYRIEHINNNQLRNLKN